MTKQDLLQLESLLENSTNRMEMKSTMTDSLL